MSDKKAELLARKEARAVEAQAAIEVLELEALELEDKYETGGQKLGIDFAIVTTAVGNFAVKKPEYIVAKRFADAEKKSIEEVTHFVAPCILFPDQPTARAAFVEHGGIAWKLAAELMKLYEADVGAKRGK